MESKGASVNNPEIKRDIEIKHFRGMDVVVNLNSLAYDREDLLEIIRETKPPNLEVVHNELTQKINALDDDRGYKRFFVKYKRSASKQHVDFIRGRSHIDYLTKTAKDDFDREARYAHVGVLSEMVLSKKIKDLIASLPFQEMAKRYGFTDFKFSEPIIAMVAKQHNVQEKYLVYKNIRSPIPLPDKFIAPVQMVEDLKKLFMDSGIIAHDLTGYQFMATEDERGSHLHLIDTEAYTEKRVSTNQA